MELLSLPNDLLIEIFRHLDYYDKGLDEGLKRGLLIMEVGAALGDLTNIGAKTTKLYIVSTKKRNAWIKAGLKVAYDGEFFF